ncbi:MAG: 2,3-bisphosphoglycerate-independent phosphoglycerate mutase [Oscillospiraceae bacterium]|jgi:2,3-bisphosphoglycerate-independent phosphoglycerate mutase|nr:2,3-bisphosphoglycerate-independent phosphoglycerate mutase [Oscillospiraceae bacterium]
MVNSLVLVILDGYGLSDDTFGNAIKSVEKNNIDNIFNKNPFIKLRASGLAVGLPDGQVGNSEVGHMSIGAGRVVLQEFTKIQKSLQDKSFFTNKEILSAIDTTIKSNGTLHLLGIVSDSGVHGHIDHLFAILDLAKSKGLDKVNIHAILDGRDAPSNSGIFFVKKCVEKIKKLKIGEISTISGRYYVMDRDNRWERVKKAYDVIANCEGDLFKDPIEAIEKSYSRNVTDEFFLPCAFQNSKPIDEKKDFFIFLNFRADRAKQFTECFTNYSFNKFKTNKNLAGRFLSFTCYDPENLNVKVAFKKKDLKNTFAEIISEKNLRQLRIAETEKYAHVTFFLNGGKQTPFNLEQRILVPSPKVSNYSLCPEMSAFEITKKAIEEMRKNFFDVIILNFANCDMVGHTGNFEATMKAVKTVDICVGKIYEEVKKTNSILIITADHGNAEKMFKEDSTFFTSHTTNLVPFCIANFYCELLNEGDFSITNVAPTMLEILGFKKPCEMTQDSLIKKV